MALSAMVVECESFIYLFIELFVYPYLKVYLSSSDRTGSKRDSHRHRNANLTCPALSPGFESGVVNKKKQVGMFHFNCIKMVAFRCSLPQHATPISCQYYSLSLSHTHTHAYTTEELVA